MPTPPDTDRFFHGIIGLVLSIGLWIAVALRAALAVRRDAERAGKPPMEMPVSYASQVGLGLVCGAIGGASMGWFAHRHVFWLMQIALYAASWLLLSCFGWFWDLCGIRPEHRREARRRAILLLGSVGVSLAIGWAAVMLWRGIAG